MIDWMSAVRIAVTGFSIVFLCLAILMVVIKIMSFLLRPVRRQEALEAGRTVVWYADQMIGRPEWLEFLRVSSYPLDRGTVVGRVALEKASVQVADISADSGDRNRLRIGCDLDAKRIVRAPFVPPPRSAVDDFYGRGRFLTTD